MWDAGGKSDAELEERGTTYWSPAFKFTPDSDRFEEVPSKFSLDL
jgi:hypothetical protein